MAVFDRMDWKVALLAIVLGTSAGVACSGSDGGDGPKPVEVNLELPSDDPGVFKLSGAVETQLNAQTADLLQPRETDEVRLRLGGVSSGDCDNVNLQVYFPITEGDTGTFESVKSKTPQFTCKSTQYVTESPIRITVETFSDGTFAGALKGTFDQNSGGDAVDPPMEVEAKFEFAYGE